MKDSYPSPCDRCTVPEASCQREKCAEWRKRYFYRQKQINAYAKQLYGTFYSGRDSFRYEHPDAVRDWLKHDPCEKCPCSHFCRKDCEVRQKWLDVKTNAAMGG